MDLVSKIIFSDSHPSLFGNSEDFENSKKWMAAFPWYNKLIQDHKIEVDNFIFHGPIYVSPVKQTYQYKMYQCPKHDVELLYEEFEPFSHRCPVDNEIITGEKYDSAWSGWYNRKLADYLFWMGILYNLYKEEKYAEAGKEILLKFADLYLKYPTENTILGPAHVFFGTLSESFWGVYMVYGYDFLYNYPGFTQEERHKLKNNLFYPLAHITQKFPESASNRQLWYNNVSAAVGFLYQDKELLDFAFNGKYGFSWELGSALPKSGFWGEGPGYHFVTLHGMIHLAEMTKRHGVDLYNIEAAGTSMKKMFDAPFDMILPNFEFPRIKDSGGGNILEYSTFYEVGYAVYKDPKYLYLLNTGGGKRCTRVVGEDSGKGEKNEPLSIFNLIPELPKETGDIYPSISTNQEGNGLAILRSSEGGEKRCLHLDYGILGGEHGHPDRMQIGYYALGKNWIVDPLNETYFNPNLQKWYRQTIAHNTIVIDETSQTWANGEEKYFGDLQGFQVASGYSNSIYPGSMVTRTVLQIGCYFIDIMDINSTHERTIDLPYHSFGKLEVHNVNLKKQPRDIFGHQPGLPGYDQLTEVYSGSSAKPVTSIFDTNDGKFLKIHTLNSENTEFFKAITPPIGGFYKQMVSDQNPLPMIFLRRFARNTRFVNLITAYEGASDISDFIQEKEPDMFCVKTKEYEDKIFVNVEENIFWHLRIKEGNPLSLNAFNVKEIKYKNKQYIDSAMQIKSLECEWNNRILNIKTGHDFIKLKIYAPDVLQVRLNDNDVAYEKKGEFIIISEKNKVVFEFDKSNDGLFIGKNNEIYMKISNLTEEAMNGQFEVITDDNIKESIVSQINWWGGIVNLLSPNKGSLETIIQPEKNKIDLAWLKKLFSKNITVKPNSAINVCINIKVPNAAPRARYDTVIKFGDEFSKKSFLVKEPVSVYLSIPNNKKELLKIKLVNNTSESQNADLNIRKNPYWEIKKKKYLKIALKPLEEKEITIPIKLKGYSKNNQLYPIFIELLCGEYKIQLKHDFYVGKCHFAEKNPSLEGDWKNWNKTNPVTIDRQDQVCRLLMGNQPWKGKDDLSAKIYSMYDNEYIYFGAEVTDDVVITHFDFPKMSYPWDTDSMEIILDTRNGGDQGFDPPTPGLYRHLCLPEYRITDFSPDKWMGGSAGGPILPKPNLIPDAETYFNLTPKGYNIICRIQLRSLKNIIAKPGYKVGFDIAINDNDGTTYRKNQHIWAGYNQNQSWWDMKTIGALIFK